METLSYKFSTDFQTRMLAVAATQPFFLGMYLDVFKPGMFTTTYHRDFCAWIAEFYSKYSVPPSKSSLTKIVKEKIPRDAPLYRGYTVLLEQIYEIEVTDHEYIKDQVVIAARFQSLKGAILRMTDQLEAGEFDQLPTTLTNAMRIGSGAGDIGSALTKSVNESILKYGVLEKPVQTGYPELERMIGGFYDGELTVFVAPPNQGKTVYLGNIAYGASRHDNVVMYYTLEIGTYRMLNRFYAKMSKKPTKELYDNIGKVRSAVKRYSLSTLGEIYVKYFPAGSISVETLRSHLAMVNGNDIHPKLVIVDYADKIRPVNPKDPPPDRVKQTYTDLRVLGEEFKCHTMTASQSTRSTLYARMIDLDDFAESWGKAQEADTVVPICQTREEKAAGVARLLGAKTRNETSGNFVYTKNNYAQLSVAEIDKEKHANIMKRAGFAVPDDQPRALQHLRKGKDEDKELEDRYSDDEDAKYVKKKFKGKRK